MLMVVSAGIFMLVVSAGMFMVVVSAGAIFVVSVIIFELSAAMFPPATVVSFAGAARGGGGGLGLRLGLITPDEHAGCGEGGNGECAGHRCLFGRVDLLGSAAD